MISRERIFGYVKEKYGIGPDYPLPTAPDFPVLRHRDSRKWFALIMEVPKERLGLESAARVDILNVKPANPLLRDLLVRQKGYFPGYHLRGSWLSILLDGTVPFRDICWLIDESFLATASGRERQEHREPREWLVPANPKYYDIVRVFEASEEINWKQGRGIRTGDTVYLYAAAPVSAILYGCTVTETDIPCGFVDGNRKIPSLMRIRLQKRCDPDQFSLQCLKEKYGVSVIRGPRGLPPGLSEDLKK